MNLQCNYDIQLVNIRAIVRTSAAACWHARRSCEDGNISSLPSLSRSNEWKELTFQIPAHLTELLFKRQFVSQIQTSRMKINFENGWKFMRNFVILSL